MRYGDSYSMGFSHFYRDHKTSLNLLAHLVALAVQLTGNFGLLLAIDTSLLPLPLLSYATALLWIVSLHLMCPNLLANVMSTLCIMAAVMVAPSLNPLYIEWGAMAAFFILFSVGSELGLQGNGGRVHPWKSIPKLTLYFGGWTLLWLLPFPFLDLLTEKSSKVAVVLCSSLLFISLREEPTLPTALLGACGGRLAFLATSNPAFFFFSLGFWGQLCQAMSHLLTGEQATLLQLEKLRGRKKLGYQLAHMHFFPSLLFEACQKSWSK